MKVQTKTTCGAHRVYGYIMNGTYEWVCIKCGMKQEAHETMQETIARFKEEGK